MRCSARTVPNSYCGETNLVTRLEQIRRDIDDKFVVAGEILHRSLVGIENLVVSLDRFTTIFDGQVVAAMKAELIVAASKLCTLPACHSQHFEHITTLTRVRAKLGYHFSAMRCYLAFLAAVSRSAQHLSATETDANFTSLIAGVHAAIADGTAEFRALETEFTALQQNLEAARCQGEILGHQIAALLPELPDDLTDAADIVGQHYTNVANTTSQVSAIARDIQSHVERILEAVQFGDITRQRVDHVLACVVRTEADAGFVTAEHRRRFRATCYALIARQLSDIDANFQRELAEIEASMREMARDAEALLTLHDITFDRDGGRKSGFLHTLSARIDGALKLVATIETADHAAMDAGRSTIETAHKLGQRIARIQSLHQTMGTAISEPGFPDVPDMPYAGIADDIREHASLLKATAQTGLETLGKLLHLANLVIDDGSPQTPQDSKAAAAAVALALAAKRIRETRDATEIDVADVAAQGDAVAQALAMSSERLSLRREIGDVLSAAAAEAARLGEDSFSLGDALPDALYDTLAGFSETYTMAPERAAHAAFLRALNIPLDAPVLPMDHIDAELF